MTTFEAFPKYRYRWPTTWLTLVGYQYRTGHHVADVVADALIRPCANPQLKDRVRETALYHFKRSLL